MAEVYDINSEKAQEVIKGLSAEIDPHLIAGRLYHSDITRNEHGSSGGSFYFIENGEEFGWANSGTYDEDELEAHFEKIEDARYSGVKLRSIIQFFPVGAKIRFTLEKGQPLKAEQFDVQMLLGELKKRIEKDAKRNDEDDAHVKTEALIEFKQEADELGMFISNTTQNKKTMRSFDFVMESDAVKGIYHFLNGAIERLYFKCENGNIEAQSQPAFEEHGLKPLTVENVEVEPEFKKRKEALIAGQKMRHDFFRSLGTLDERVLYLRVGGFRDHSWPENSTSHNCCKMRVIHAPESTILISDGLSDIYMSESQDKDLKYNGIGAEFYIEFHGNIAYETIHKHYAMALLNSVTQIAIGHGDFQKFMKHHGTTTIEFTDENVEVWINRENNANHGFASFLTEEKFRKGNSFAVLLGMESKTVPLITKMNLEEILLVNVKPVENKWLTSAKLKSKDQEKVKAAREKVIEGFKESGEWNLVPLTYQKEYVEGEPDSSGTRLVPIFPF